MTRIVGIRGGKGAGKDTAARYLVEKYGARQYASADDLKTLAAAVYGLRPEQLHGTQAAKEAVDPRTGLSGRQAMTRLGRAVRRVFGRTFWIDRVIARILTESPELAVISDVRFLHEADRIREVSGDLWRLHYAPGLHPGAVTEESEAEWMLGDVDLEITPGPGGVAELYPLLDRACEQFDIRSVAATGTGFTASTKNA